MSRPGRNTRAPRPMPAGTGLTHFLLLTELPSIRGDPVGHRVASLAPRRAPPFALGCVRAAGNRRSPTSPAPWRHAHVHLSAGTPGGADLPWFRPPFEQTLVMEAELRAHAPSNITDDFVAVGPRAFAWAGSTHRSSGERLFNLFHLSRLRAVDGVHVTSSRQESRGALRSAAPECSPSPPATPRARPGRASNKADRVRR